MNSYVKEIYDSYLNYLTVKELQIIYDESLKDIRETEKLHFMVFGFSEEQKEEYEYLKDNLSIYSILEQRAEQAFFDQIYQKRAKSPWVVHRENS